MTQRTTTNPTREFRTVAAPLSTQGFVTRLIVSMVGEQSARITTTADNTDAASLQLELPNLIMQFTGADQVQHMLGFCAFARQASMDMVTNYAQPAPVDDHVQLRNIVTWLTLPTGTVTREEMPNPFAARARAQSTYPSTDLTKPIPYLLLTFSPVTLRILDTTALDSLLAALQRAHTTAAAVFPDGRHYRTDPTRPNWKPRGRSYRSQGWTPDTPV